MANVIFKVGTKALFDALEQKDTNTLYWLEDVQELYKGNLLFATGKTASETAAGLMSADDKIKLDSLSPGTLTGLTPVDASVIIADGEDGKTIGVQLSKEAGNTIVLKTDGLFAAGTQAPEFAIEKQGEAAEGYAATYRLKRTLGDETTYVGDSINIPKDLVVQSGSVKTVTEADQPYEGAEVGDTYIDLQLNDSASSHIYIPAKGLIDTSDFVVQVIESQNGEAIIQNEPTGGGAKFHHIDGTESFYANVKDYVDTKIADVVAGSIEGLGALASKDKVAESDLEATLATKINGKANVGTADDTSDMDTLKGAKKYADEKAAAVQTEVDALEAKVGTVPESKTVVQMIEEAQEAATYDDTEIKAKVQANTNAIGVLNGEATVEGSVKKTVADEIAKVIADAPESFDTLKEISDWISSHSDDAAAMNSAITALQGILDGIGDTESGEKATVVAYVTDAIAALNIGDYATAAQLTALAGRVTTLEGASHTHANKELLDTYTQTEANLADAVAKKHTHANATELDKIANGDKAKWDAAEQNAKDYADSLASDYDAAGSAAEALADAKEYTDTALTWGSF